MMTEEQKRKKRERKRESQNSNSSNLVEEVTPTLQIICLDTKPFVIFTDALFPVDLYF